MTADEFRRIALSQPGAVEGAHMNHPDFRIGGRVFASLGYPDEAWGMVKLSADVQGDVIARAPATFKPAKGAWGLAGSTLIHLASVDVQMLQGALQLAAAAIVSASKSATAKRRSAKRK